MPVEFVAESGQRTRVSRGWVLSTLVLASWGVLSIVGMVTWGVIEMIF